MVKRGEYIDFIKNLDVDKVSNIDSGYSTNILILKEMFEYIEELEKRIEKLEKKEVKT